MKNNKKLLRLIFLFTLLLVGSWGYGLTLFVKTIPTEVANSESLTDGIVILTGGSNRLDTGIKLLNQQKAEKLLISGVGEETTIANLLILSGNLPDNIIELMDKIELDYKAQNTIGNAIEAANWVKKNNYKSIRLVTSNYHINRSVTEFEKQLPDIEIIPHPVFPREFVLNKWWRHSATKKVLISEYNKLLISKLRSFI